MTRTLVLVVFLAAWLGTGIVAGIVMGRRHNQFSWSLLGVAFGALMVPLALGRECREEPTGPAGSLSAPQDRSVPVLLSINDSREAATTLTATATRSSTETSYHDILPIGATPDKPRMRVGRT
jgi:hypothetical protein